ncbi:MAG: PASTA domain-containing protein [Chitinispirillaceae bacterium]|nr:PASTA domain-containing protein [Chitinispirillaceae bacterium]
MNQFRIRLAFIVVLLTAGSAVVVGRLFTVQVLERERYVQRSRDQTHQRRIVPARRGSLVDRFGRTLAVSMRNPLSVEPDALGLRGRRPEDNAVVKRIYPLGDIAGTLLGFIGTDGYGLGGAELAFDPYLRGEDGWTILQKDGRNCKYQKIGLPEKAQRSGFDVVLTIDINVQKIVQGILRNAVNTLRAKGGMCVVMEPSTGAILAMADEPSFNPNLPGRSTLSQRQNRCISTVYEPGSTFKLVTASIALEEKLKNENDLIYGDKGSYRIYDQTIRDHTPYGYLTFAKALAYSSNVCFAKIANEIPNDKFYRYVRDFGFGTRTGIDLPGEECGIVHPVKKWSGRTRVTMAIGQEISSTLLQMVQPYAAVANGGVLVSPKIIEKVIDPRGRVVDSGSYKPVRRVLSGPVAARLRVMLQDVVENGTGKNAAISQVAVAGKTGTSQKPDSGGYSRTRLWSSFIGFVPVNSPQLLCAVVIDEPARGEMGAEAAAPIFRKIITQIISHPELEFAEKILKSDTVPMPRKMPRNVQVASGRQPHKSRRQSPDSDDARSILPDCIGKDLRDAINLVNRRGFRPFAVGYGTVHRQVPPAGTKIAPAAACTLFCSLKG